MLPFTVVPLAVTLISGGCFNSVSFCCRRGPARYKFQTLIELGSFAAVNVRDMGSVKTAFKLLAFPDTRLFQCTSNQSKVNIPLHFFKDFVH